MYWRSRENKKHARKNCATVEIPPSCKNPLNWGHVTVFNQFVEYTFVVKEDR